MPDMEDHRKNYNYFADNFEELDKLYDGKVLLIVRQKLVGAYDTLDEAHAAGVSNYGIGKFSMLPCKREWLCLTTGLRYNIKPNEDVKKWRPAYSA